MFFNKKKKEKNKIFEEDIFIQVFGTKISRDLEVFYNPVMKLNRDISLLVINTYFTKPIKFCDPMAASGIRELRFLKTIPQKFESIILGDISKNAIKQIKANFKANKISTKKIKLVHNFAINTINSSYFNLIEIDPFGSPVPFLDVACQKIKHEGILSVTATDTAALCGTYPKTTLRKYGINVIKTHYYEELGLRNLIAYCMRQGAKYEKALTPLISYSNSHYYKIFFKVEDSRQKSHQNIKELSYITWDKKTQMTLIISQNNDIKLKDLIGKTYVGPLCNKEFLSNIKSTINLIKDSKEITKLIDNLLEESDDFGHYNPHKLQKEFKFSSSLKFDEIIERLKEKGFRVSRPHNNRLGIKTNAKGEDIVNIMKRLQ